MHNYRRFYMRKGPVPLPLARHGLPPPLPARLPEGLPQGRLPAQLLRSRQEQLLGSADQGQGRLPLRHLAQDRAGTAGGLGIRGRIARPRHARAGRLDRWKKIRWSWSKPAAAARSRSPNWRKPRRHGERTGRDARPPVDRASRIGPNSVLQLVPLLDDAFGVEEREHLMRLSGIERPAQRRRPDGGRPAARLHQAVRAEHPEAAALTREAGERTGDYIIRHRIPVAALRVLRRCRPGSRDRSWPGHRKHAWTFAGSGKFRVVRATP
jgi:hypothetical protein